MGDDGLEDSWEVVEEEEVRRSWMRVTRVASMAIATI